MYLYNSMTRTKEEFIPISPGEVKMYVCGPTVYNYIHVGNAMPAIIFDAFRRYLEYRGFNVTYVQNFTDIDDKIINRAHEEGVSISQISEKYIEEYFKDADGLGVQRATIHPRATENVSEIIELVSALISKGLAYESHGDVYFRTSQFDGYGKLSHQPLDELMSGARISQGEHKENPMDFALWKSAKSGEPSWPSPWGDGRPGWHIECSAMAKRYLGDTIDIHCGGTDLTFPHHENEIAQSEGASGVRFVNYWLHNAFMNIDNKKMSKSLGNFFTVREAAQTYGYENIRMLILMSHYRSPLNYSGDVLLQSKSALQRLKTARRNLEFKLQSSVLCAELCEGDDISGISKYRERFVSALDDDFNTADAISVIFELVREANTKTAGTPSKPLVRTYLDLLNELTNVLGLLYTEDAGIDAEIEALISARSDARAQKNWAEADRIRDELTARGIILEDTAQGVKWRYGELV